jgi:hypothetical protein
MLWNLGFGVCGLGLRVKDLGFRVRGLGIGVKGLGFGVKGLGFRVWGLGFGGFRLGVYVLYFRVWCKIIVQPKIPPTVKRHTPVVAVAAHEPKTLAPKPLTLNP